MYRRERERERSAIRRPKGSPFLRAGDANCPKRIEIPPTMVVDAMKGVLGIRFVDRTMGEEKIKKEILYRDHLRFYLGIYSEKQLSKQLHTFLIRNLFNSRRSNSQRVGSFS